jgi:hypothetical protein
MGRDIAFARANQVGLLETKSTGYRERCLETFEIIYTNLLGKEFFLDKLGEEYYEYQPDSYSDQDEDVQKKLKERYDELLSKADFTQIRKDINNITIDDINKYITEHGGHENTIDALINQFYLYEDEDETLEERLADHIDTITQLLDIIEEEKYLYYHIG